MKNLETITSIKLSFKQKAFITAFTGGLIGLITMLTLYLLDGTNWKIISEASAFINGMILWGFGLLIAHIYYRNQFKKHEGLTLIFEGENIRIIKNSEKSQFSLESLVQLKLNQQFYFLFGLISVTFSFKSENQPKLKSYHLLLFSEEAQSLNKIIRNLKSKQTSL